MDPGENMTGIQEELLPFFDITIVIEYQDLPNIIKLFFYNFDLLFTSGRVNKKLFGCN